jgi:BirA family transcriptional regulator, biotin operon repressor / biotin---[acetyl-CoA-carboxylase] ligase
MHLSEEILLRRLHPRPLRYFEQVGSTNDEALKWMSEGAATGSVVVAGEQVKGKGRLGRTWHTPPASSLIVSVILHPPVASLSQVTMIGALAIYDMVKQLGLEQVGIKWPNDVMLNGLKLSGILPEAVWDAGNLVGVVLGMGINVRIDFANSELEHKAISIETILGRRIERLDLIQQLLANVDYWTASLGREEVFNTWRDRLMTLGQPVRVQIAEQEIAGMAQSVDSDGALLIQKADGQIERVIAGDIALG